MKKNKNKEKRKKFLRKEKFAVKKVIGQIGCCMSKKNGTRIPREKTDRCG